jgi:PIN domain nuclease of toxin-antitoxin system
VRLLLDTHTFLWWLAGHRMLSSKAREAIEIDESEVFVSAVSAWEITTKFRIGKLPEAELVANDVYSTIEAEGFSPLAISVQHAQRAGSFGGTHRDPFDRLLAAQAMLENLTLVSNDRAFEQYAVERLW